MTIWLNWIVLCFINPFLEIFNLRYLYTLWVWRQAKSQGEESELTQQEANT